MPNDSDNPLEPVTGSEMFHRAMEKFEQGDLDAALRYADGALELGHVDADICLLKAQIYFDWKNLDEALAWVDEAGAFNPLNVEVLLWRGRIFAAQRKFRRALGCYGRILEREPNHGDAVMHRGIAFFELGEADKAIAAFDEASQLAGEHNDEREAELLYWRAKLERTLGNVESARKHLEDALKRYDQHIATYAELGDLLRTEARNNRDLRRAKRIYERGLAVEPNDPALHNDYGNLLRELRDLEGSIKHLSRAIEINPRHEVAYFNRGLTYEELGQVERAVKDFHRAVEIDPNDTDAKLKALDSLLALERFGEAERLWQGAQASDPEHTELAWSAADLYGRWALFAEGHADYVTALCCHRKLLDVAPDLMDISEHVPYFATLEERWRAAVRGCLRLLAEPSLDTPAGERLKLDARLYAGVCHLRLHEYAQAEEILSELVELVPDESSALGLLAQVYVETNRPQAALMVLDAALTRKPESPELLWEKALLLEGEPVRDVEQAIACHEAILAISPSFRTCHEPLARLYEEIGEPSRALYHLRRYVLDLVEAGQYTGYEAALQALAGRLYLAMGWYERAVERLHTALEQARKPAAPDSPSASAAETKALDLPAHGEYGTSSASISTATGGVVEAWPRNGSDDNPTASAKAANISDDGSALAAAAALHLGEAQLLLGLGYAQLERHREARIYLDKVAADYAHAEPELAAEACQALADVTVQLGALDEARLNLEQAAALAPGETRERLLARLRLAIAEQAWPRAEELAAEVLARSPSRDEWYAEGQRLRTALYLHTGRLELAREALSEALSLKPLDVEFASLALAVAEAQGNPEPARAQLAFVEARAEALAQLRRAEPDDALATLEQARGLLAPAAYTAEMAEALHGELDLLVAVAHAQRLDLPMLLAALRSGLTRLPERIEAVRYEPALDPFTDSPEVIALLQEVAAEALAEGRVASAPRILPPTSAAATTTTRTTAPAATPKSTSGRHRSVKDDADSNAERAPRAANDPPSSGVTDEELMRDALHGIDWDSLRG